MMSLYPRLLMVESLYLGVLLSLQAVSILLLVVHNLKTGQDIVHEFCETDFAFKLVEGGPEPDQNGDLDIESKLLYRLD